MHCMKRSRMKMEERRSSSMFRLILCLSLSWYMPFSDQQVLLALCISVRLSVGKRGYGNRSFSNTWYLRHLGEESRAKVKNCLEQWSYRYVVMMRIVRRLNFYNDVAVFSGNS